MPDQWAQLLCCRTPNYYFDQCADFKGGKGEQLECAALLGVDNAFIEGICGSGRYNDCYGESHIVSECFELMQLDFKNVIRVNMISSNFAAVGKKPVRLIEPNSGLL